MMSRNEEQRNQVFKIKNCKKFNIKTTRNAEKFCRRIYIIYLT